ncbi:MAG: hypothetical protein ACOH17_02505 [Cellulomonas sp.]
MPTRQCTAPAAAFALLIAVALTSACTSSNETVADTGPTWPAAITLPADSTTQFWVVWTAVADSKDGLEAELQPSVDQLKAAGYDAKPWDPSCQTGAKEALVALTGYADPVAVGLVFASDKDAGTFDTLYDGPVVSVTPGTNTCVA